VGDSSFQKHFDMDKQSIPGIYDLFPLIIPGTTILSMATQPEVFLCDPSQLTAKRAELERTYHQLYIHKKDMIVFPHD